MSPYYPPSAGGGGNTQAPVPLTVAAGTIFTINANGQMAYGQSIVNNGTIVNNGALVKLKSA